MTAAERARTAFLAYRDSGRPEALAEVFDLCAQELLLVAHHLARPGVAPEDLLQSTFLTAIQRADSYDASCALMPWLCGILANVARSQNRREGRQVDRDRRPAGTVEDPLDVVHAREFAQAVAAAIEALPPRMREVLSLRLVHGLTPTEIAHALGHPVGSVKSWVHRGVERLRQVLPAGFAATLAIVVSADRSLAAVRARVLAEAVATPSEPSSARPSASSAWSATGAWLAVGALLVLGGVLVWRGPGGVETAGADTSVVVERALDQPSLAATLAPARGAATARVGAPSVDAPRGTRFVARFAADGEPASIALLVEPLFGKDPALRARTFVTDAQGEVLVGELPPGAYEVVSDRGVPFEVDVGPGSGIVAIEVADARRVVGRVSDAFGRPIADARIWLSSHAGLHEGQCATRTDAAGEYELRGVPEERALAVLADGYACSAMAAVRDAAATDRADEVRIDFQLGPPVAALEGRVVDARGAPLAGAWVQVGVAPDPTWDSAICRVHEVVPSQALVTDGDGRFVCPSPPAMEGVRAWARAPGKELHRGVVPDRPRDWTIPLDDGARWRGRARSAPRGALLTVESELDVDDLPPRWATPSAVVGADADIDLGGLPPGRVRLRADDPEGRWDTFDTTLAGGELVEWSPDLAREHRLVGRAVDADGGALAGYRVVAVPRRGPMSWVAADSDGRFVLSPGEGPPWVVWVHGPQGGYPGTLVHALVQRDDQPLELVVPRQRRPDAYLVARAIDADGSVLSDLRATSAMDETIVPGTLDEHGRTRIGPLPPGPYYFTVAGSRGLALLHGPVTALAGREVDCGELKRAELGDVRLRVEHAGDPQGANCAARLLTLDGALTPSFFVVENGEGLSSPVPPGRYLCSVFDERLGTLQQEVEVREGATSEVLLRGEASVDVTLVVHGDTLVHGQRLLFVWRRDDGQRSVRSSMRVPEIEGGIAISRWLLPAGGYEVEVTGCEGEIGRLHLELGAHTRQARFRLDLD